MRGPHVLAANVIQAAVIGLADERVHRSHVLVAGLIERPPDESIHDRADTQRIGQRDRRFDRAELVNLRRSGELAEGVADKHRARHFVLEDVALMRHDDGHAGANAVTLVERQVTDGDAGDVGDRVLRSGLEHAGRQSEVAGARPGILRGELHRRQRQATAQDELLHHAPTIRRIRLIGVAPDIPDRLRDCRSVFYVALQAPVPLGL